MYLQPKTGCDIITNKNEQTLINGKGFPCQEAFPPVTTSLKSAMDWNVDATALEQTETGAADRLIVHHDHDLIEEIIERAPDGGQGGESFIVLLAVTKQGGAGCELRGARGENALGVVIRRQRR